jgi:hypothetical protein
MFYWRINKIKVRSNREGFLGLFGKAEVRIYAFSLGCTGADCGDIPALAAGDLMKLPDDGARRDLLKRLAAEEANRFAQSVCLEINGVKDNQSLYFGDAGLVGYRSENIPDTLAVQLWAIESDEDIRSSMKDADAFLDGSAFDALLQTVGAALSSKNPVVGSAIALGAVVAGMIRKKLRDNGDDLIGYWQATLNRAEHFPHGTRDRQDVPDTTGNMTVDYTIFGF